MTQNLFLALAIASFILAGCGGRETSPAPPPPATLTEESTGYYCGMLLIEHKGPKAQIFVAGNETPLWFSQVRDGIHFIRAPEEAGEVLAFYVTDYADLVGHDPAVNPRWIAANDAFFAIESKTRGGMGAPEALPFSTEGAAAQFVSRWGGRVARLADIPDAYILAPYDGAKINTDDEAHASQ